MNGIEGPKVIHIDGELYYHSEWLKTRHKVIERLEEENNRLKEERDSFQRVGIRSLEKLKMAEDALQTAYSYIEQTDRGMNKKQLLDALKQLRED